MADHVDKVMGASCVVVENLPPSILACFERGYLLSGQKDSPAEPDGELWQTPIAPDRLFLDETHNVPRVHWRPSARTEQEGKQIAVFQRPAWDNLELRVDKQVAKGLAAYLWETVTCGVIRLASIAVKRNDSVLSSLLLLRAEYLMPSSSNSPRPPR